MTKVGHLIPHSAPAVLGLLVLDPFVVGSMSYPWDTFHDPARTSAAACPSRRQTSIVGSLVEHHPRTVVGRARRE